jgi:hypothetical protein
MEHPAPQQALAAPINEFSIAIRLLLDTDHTKPALIIMYAAIDTFGAWLRPEAEIDTVGKAGGYFRKWAGDYLLGDPKLTCTPDDLWGARCGLLHTHTPSSKDSRDGKAREIAYHHARAPTPEMQRELESKRQSLLKLGKVPVDVEVLYSAFEQGSQRFLADILRDPQLQKRAFHHSPALFGVWRYDG